MPAARRAGAAETAAAPPSKYQPRTQHIVRWSRNRSAFAGRASDPSPLVSTPRVHVPSLWRGRSSINVSLCTAGSRTAVPSFCTLTLLTPSLPIVSEGQRCRTKLWWLSDVKAVVVQRKDFRVFSFLFFNFNLQRLLFSPREICRVMYRPLTFRAKTFVIYWIETEFKTSRVCRPVAVSSSTPPLTCFKLFSPDYLVWSKDFSLSLSVQIKGGRDRNH